MRKRLILGGTVGLILALSLALGIFAVIPHDAFAATVRNVRTNCGGQLPPICYTSVHAAINAAVAGDTVLVHQGTFTETSTLNITVPLRLQGLGPGVSILRGSLNPEAIAITLSSHGTLTIAGFTLEGNNLPHPGASDLITIMNAQGSNTIRVTHNAFLSNSDVDPNHGTSFTEAMHNFDSTSARLEVTHNTFEGFSQVSELFNYVGPVNVADNVVEQLNGSGFHNGFDEFTCCDPLAIPNPHVYSHNIFTKYSGSGILIESNNARFDDMELLNNSFSISGPNGTSAISVGGFETAGRVKLSARDNSIQLSGGMDGIQIHQDVLGAIAHNAITGSSAAGSNGIAVAIGSAQPTNLTIQSNRITTYDTGLSVATAAPPGGSATQTVVAHDNCIFSNATFGADNTTAITVDATNNWWGAVSGPFNAASNPGGTGNAVSNGITFIPFLIALSPTCP